MSLRFQIEGRLFVRIARPNRVELLERQGLAKSWLRAFIQIFNLYSALENVVEDNFAALGIPDQLQGLATARVTLVQLVRYVKVRHLIYGGWNIFLFRNIHQLVQISMTLEFWGLSGHFVIVIFVRRDMLVFLNFYFPSEFRFDLFVFVDRSLFLFGRAFIFFILPGYIWNITFEFK